MYISEDESALPAPVYEPTLPIVSDSAPARPATRSAHGIGPAKKNFLQRTFPFCGKLFKRKKPAYSSEELELKPIPKDALKTRAAKNTLYYDTAVWEEGKNSA
ncbi:MAG: hypothetical protein K2X94_04780 [Amoebophilaceae bacterium]|nr:hypothetical protein [Amoebophilaceae bacterium]